MGKRPKQTPYQKIIHMENKHMEKAQQHVSLRKCKLKQDITIRMAKILNTTTPNACKDVQPQQLSSIAVRMQNSRTTSKDSLAVSCKTKHVPTKWSSNHTSWHLLKGAENFYPPKSCTQMFIVAIFIIGKQPRHPSVGEWINKLWCHTNNEVLFSTKEK